MFLNNLMGAKDYNGNGAVDSEDIELYNSTLKNMGQMAIAWVALAALLILTCALCTHLISLDRIKVLEGILTTVYIALSSLVGASVGFTSWMTKK